MRSRFRCLSLIVPAALWASLPAAAKPPPDVESLPDAPRSAVLVAPAGSMSATCVLGETRPGVYSVNYLLPPNDAYYTLLRRSECAVCPGPAVVYLGTAHLRLHFPTACTQPVAVSVVGAIGDSCPVPDPTVVLCPPTAYDLTPPATGFFDFVLPLPADCGIPGTAFLCIDFVARGAGCSTVTTVPRLVTTDDCLACRSYNIYRGGAEELCALAFPGNPVMSVDVVNCDVAVGPEHVAGVSLSAAMPNPSRGRTTLRLALEAPARVRARMCDIAGRIVRVLADEPLAAGVHALQWDGRDQRGVVVAPGVYFCRVLAGPAEFTRTIVVAR